MPSSTDELAVFVSALNDGVLPSTICELVSQHVLDVIAGIYAGTRIVEAISVAALTANDDAALCGKLAMLSHAAESDPIHAGTTICAGLITVPPALIFSPDGATAIAAVIAGYETAIRLGEALGSSRLLGRGWWPTAVLGGAGAAAATSRALDLRADQTRHAISLALVQAGGIGTGAPDAPESRNLLAANTIRIGVEAAHAAAAGVEGPPDPLTGDRGFFNAFGFEPDPGRLLRALGVDWKIAETSLKVFPCALQAQSALTALRDAIATNDLSTAEIDAVQFGLPEAMHRIVHRPGRPGSRFAAAADLRFLAAAFLCDGDILPARLDDDARVSADIVSLMDKISVTHDPELDRAFPAAWPAWIRISTAAGTFCSETLNPPGHPDRPIDISATIERFRAYSGAELDPAAQNATIDLVQGLAALKDMTTLTEPLRALL
jgi:2-methylcitrate dehydratase PrpD